MRPWEVPYATRFAGRKPRVAVGFIAFGDICPESFISNLEWAYKTGRDYGHQFEVFIGTAERREQYRARNNIIDVAREACADFVLMVDDDHTLADAPHLIRDFFNEEKPLQGALYAQRNPDGAEHPVIQKHDPATGIIDWCGYAELPAGNGPVDILGGGVHWLDMTLVDFMDQPFHWPFPKDDRRVVFIPEQRYGLDINFCLRAKRELGVQPWLNRKVCVGHVLHEREVIRPMQAPAYTPMTQAAFAHREAFRPAYSDLADVLCREFEFHGCLDVGAGQGFLVDALAERGKVVLGVEKEQAAKEFMSPFAKSAILIEDFAESAKMLSTFDLVSCVEVAEHIPEAEADTLVDSLLAVAKNQIFFTADSTDVNNPHHVNCQPKSYWIEKFAARGWRYDAERAKRISDSLTETVTPWIPNNAMVFIKEAA